MGFKARLLTVFLISLSLFSDSAFAESVFRFHLATEPTSLAPNKISYTDGSAFFFNLYRGLYSFSNEKGLQPEGADKCTWGKDKLSLLCKLSKKSLWSDGKAIEAQDYVRAWRELFDTDAKAAGSELLLRVKNAKAILAGQKKKDELGVSALDADTLKVEFEKKDSDFLNKLALVPLVPIRSETSADRKNASSLITNGPYKILEWKPGKRVVLVPNEKFHSESAALRPRVEILFIEEDLTALNLYESGELSMLRRLPTQRLSSYSSKPEFHSVPFARFDYIGFGTELRNKPHLRKALTLSADYPQLQKIYGSPGTPGCPCLPDKLFAKYPCLKFDLPAAKKELELGRKSENLPARLQIYFTKISGDSVEQGLEWYQGQWTKNLNLKVDMVLSERGALIQQLKTNAPDIFRKGIVLARPTCLAALENFVTDAPENYLKFSDKEYDQIVAKLEDSSSENQKKRLCSEGVGILLNKAVLIPQGRFFDAMLVRTNFKGWTINELNQLDLTNLKSSM